ncbi:MAG: hypothetical protein ACFFD4_35275 [Candidatus Odinarchaeota archaeon]
MVFEAIIEIIQQFQIVISAVVAIASILVTALLELRKRRKLEKQEKEKRERKMAVETLTVRLLPFYNQLLKILNRLDLLGVAEFKIKLNTLQDDIDKLYTHTGKAFFTIEDNNQRQLILDTLQMLDLFSKSSELVDDIFSLNNLRSDIILMLGSIKQIIEEDLRIYRSTGDFPQYEDETKVDFEGYIEIKQKSMVEILERFDDA